jgi:peptide/nickel transport system permease protein
MTLLRHANSSSAPQQRRDRKLSRWLLFVLALHLLIFAAGFFAPYDPAVQDRDHPYLPPMPIHFMDAQHHFHARPFFYSLRPKSGSFDQYEEDISARIPVQFFLTGAGYHLFGFLPSRVHFFGTPAPNSAETNATPRLYLLGTDAFGRDLLSRILYGGQISLLAGLLGAAVTLTLGALIGLTAGFFGGWRDDLLMRLAELFLALPWLYLLFALRAFLPLSVSALQAFFLVVLVIGVVGWARPARLVRSVALSIKERDFVRAARGFGASNFYLLRRHVFPETASLLLTQAAILIPQFILAEMTLSFLGLGVPEPAPSWGNLLAALQQYSVLVSYWWMYLPALIILPFFLGYLGLASALQQRFQPFKINVGIAQAHSELPGAVAKEAGV